MEYYNYNSELESVKSQVVKLEREVEILRKSVFRTKELYNQAIDKIPVPVLIINKRGKLELINSEFIKLLNFKSRNNIASADEIVGLNISEVVDHTIYEHIEPFISQGVTFENKDFVIKDFRFTLSIHGIRGVEFAAIVLKMIVDNEDKNEELISRLESVLENNFEMIQKIGSLMGEEVSKNTESINSIIKLIK